MNDAEVQMVVLAGATGDLGRRIAAALRTNGVNVRGLVRQGTAANRKANLVDIGVEPVVVAFDDRAALTEACRGAACVVSALNGVEPIILGAQSRILDAAVAAGVPRFIPSDFAVDFTKTEPGHNRNLDLRRTFMDRVDRAPIRATSILNGAFADLLTGDAPLLLRRVRRILYWGSPDQPYDFTTKDDVADYTARVALDGDAPRIVRIAGDTASPHDLARIMSQSEGRPWKTFRAGGVDLLGKVIGMVRTLTPKTDAPFPAWQGMQYLRDMSTGKAKLTPLDNDRYGKRRWTTVVDILSTPANT